MCVLVIVGTTYAFKCVPGEWCCGVTGDAANGAYCNEVQLKTERDWRNIEPGTLTREDFDLIFLGNRQIKAPINLRIKTEGP